VIYGPILMLAVATVAHARPTAPCRAGRGRIEVERPRAGEGVRPLLVLDAGTFLARCRRCGWSSPRESTLGKALVAIGLHACEERSG
jgi:hypothetical protein